METKKKNKKLGRTEQKKFFSKKYLSLFSEVTSNHIATINVHKNGGLELDWRSPNFSAIHGVSKDTIKTLDDWEKNIHPDDLEICKNFFKNIIGKGIKAREKMTFRAINPKNNEIRWLKVTGYTLSDPQQKHKMIIFITVKNITDKLLFEKKLVESEQLSRALLDGSPNLAILVDCDTTISYANHPMAESLGKKSPRDLIGRKARYLLGSNTKDKETIQKRFKSFDRCIKTKKPVYITDYRDGRWFSTKFYPILDVKENVKQIAIYARDITAEKQKENMLRESEEKLRSIFKHSPNIILTLKKNGVITYINRTISGIPPQKIIGKRVYDYIPPEYHQIVQDCYKSVWETKKPKLYEIQATVANGETIWTMNHAGALQDKGKVHGLIVITADITQLKKIEHRLKESEKKYRSIFDESPEAIVLLNNKGIFLDINDRVTEWLEYTKEEIINKSISDQEFLTDESKENIMLKFAERMKGKTVPPYELEFITKQGEKRIGRVRATPIKDNNGQIIGDLALISDITELKEMEDHMLEQEKLVALGQIAAVVSHELNTPLANIGITTEYLSSVLPQGYLEELKTIQKEVSIASDVIHRVLGFSNMDDLQIKETDLSQVVQDALETVQMKTGISKKIFDIHFTTPCMIQGDEYRLREIFINIIKNAVEALHTEKKNNCITIKCIPNKETVAINITDTGAGIDNKTLSSITKPFITTKPPAEGAGLGLFISSWIIDKHGGDLQIDTKKGEGTTVTVVLPRQQ